MSRTSSSRSASVRAGRAVGTVARACCPLRADQRLSMDVTATASPDGRRFQTAPSQGDRRCAPAAVLNGLRDAEPRPGATGRHARPPRAPRPTSPIAPPGRRHRRTAGRGAGEGRVLSSKRRPATVRAARILETSGQRRATGRRELRERRRVGAERLDADLGRACCRDCRAHARRGRLGTGFATSRRRARHRQRYRSRPEARSPASRSPRPTGRASDRPSTDMVGATGIEPVTPTMST